MVSSPSRTLQVERVVPNALQSSHGEHHTSNLTLPIASSDKVAPDEISQTPLRSGSGGNGCAVLHSNLCHAWLRCSLLDARPLRYEASTSWRETSHYVDGCVRRLQLRPAPVRRLSGRPFPVEPEPVCWRHGTAGVRLPMHRDRHTSAVLHRPRTFPNGQRPQRH